jgi:hypothetical protein
MGTLHCFPPKTQFSPTTATCPPHVGYQYPAKKIQIHGLDHKRKGKTLAPPQQLEQENYFSTVDHGSFQF